MRVDIDRLSFANARKIVRETTAPATISKRRCSQVALPHLTLYARLSTEMGASKYLTSKFAG